MKALIERQMTAALDTLNQCMENCPPGEWDKSHNDAPFSQVLFHTLFCTDYYLSADESEFKLQQFHAENKTIFRDYEELEYKKAEQIYTKPEIKTYFNFCRQKIDAYCRKIGPGPDDLLKKSAHKEMEIIELLIYITRHIQHHAAQLGLRIQQVTGKELNWVSRGVINQPFQP